MRHLSLTTHGSLPTTDETPCDLCRPSVKQEKVMRTQKALGLGVAIHTLDYTAKLV